MTPHAIWNILNLIASIIPARHHRHYKKFFTVLPLPAIIVNNSGILIDANVKFCKMLGYERKEIKGTRFMRYVHPMDGEHTVAGMTILTSGGVVEGFNNRYITKEGRIVKITWSACAANGFGAIAVVTKFEMVSGL